MLTRRFFILLISVILLAVAGAAWAPLLIAAYIAAALLGVATLYDAIVTFIASRLLTAKRVHADAFSLAQPNAVTLTVTMHAPKWMMKSMRLQVFDTPPRGWAEGVVTSEVNSGNNRVLTMRYEATQRGRHEFNIVRCFVTSRVPGLFESRRFIKLPTVVKVFPTFRELDKIELKATLRDAQHGTYRLQRAGNNTEFEQIRPYVAGDDRRTINWRATARATALMVNSYTDERSKPIVPIVCAGPSMLITTEGGISLLDRACSAAIALASSALRRYDEAGLITLTHEGIDTYIQAERSRSTLSRLLKATYDFGLPPTPTESELVADPDVKPQEGEKVDDALLAHLHQRVEATMADPDYNELSNFVTHRLSRRSMLMLFANFENIEVARLAIPALHRMARKHAVVVVLFENSSIEDVVSEPYRGGASAKVSEQRFRAICAEYIEQKHRLAAYLRSQHINVVITKPENLTAATLQAYLSLKSRAVV